MAAPHTHNKQLQAWADDYLADVGKTIGRKIKALNGAPAYRELYRISLSLDCVFLKLGEAGWKPSSKSLRSLALRVPLLVAVGQSSTAAMELRRLSELAFWVIYFEDHSREWQHFLTHPSDGYHPTVDLPIRYCAHRGVKFYMDYADELLAAEPSGMARAAVGELRRLVSELNAIVHPSGLASGAHILAPFEGSSEVEIRAFNKRYREIGGNLVVVLAAVYRKKFDHLPAVHRGHFDWLIGSVKSMQLRRGEFGLSDD